MSVDPKIGRQYREAVVIAELDDQLLAFQMTPGPNRDSKLDNTTAGLLLATQALDKFNQQQAANDQAPEQ